MLLGRTKIEPSFPTMTAATQPKRASDRTLRLLGRHGLESLGDLGVDADLIGD